MVFMTRLCYFCLTQWPARLLVDRTLSHCLHTRLQVCCRRMEHYCYAIGLYMSEIEIRNWQMTCSTLYRLLCSWILLVSKIIFKTMNFNMMFLASSYKLQHACGRDAASCSSGGSSSKFHQPHLLPDLHRRPMNALPRLWAHRVSCCTWSDPSSLTDEWNAASDKRKMAEGRFVKLERWARFVGFHIYLFICLLSNGTMQYIWRKLWRLNLTWWTVQLSF